MVDILIIQHTCFGANCYGIKPKPKDREQEKVLAFTKNQKIMLDKINMYKSQMNEMTVLPFNKNMVRKRKIKLISSR